MSNVKVQSSAGYSEKRWHTITEKLTARLKKGLQFSLASRVEYIKAAEKMRTALIHVGADLFLRECYNPNDWHHEISIADNEGHLKPADEKDYAIAGPLCFGGDMLEKNIRMPNIETGDYVFIHDTGANTLSLWSRHNSRQMPKVIGYYDNGSKLEILKAREDADKLWDFWR